MKIDSFEQYFHPSWWIKLKPFLESKDFEEIWDKIKEFGVKGKIIYPYSKLLKNKYPNWDSNNTIFNAFKTDLNKLQVLIFTELPNDFTKVINDKPITLGIPMHNTILSGSLNDYYDCYENEFHNGLNLNVERNINLDFLNDQGIMILGNSLTAENTDISHFPVWEPLMKEVFKILKESFKGLHIVLIGSNTHRIANTMEKDHYIYKCRDFTKIPFKEIKETIKSNTDEDINFAFEKAPF